MQCNGELNFTFSKSARSLRFCRAHRNLFIKLLLKLPPQDSEVLWASGQLKAKSMLNFWRIGLFSCEGGAQQLHFGSVGPMIDPSSAKNSSAILHSCL